MVPLCDWLQGYRTWLALFAEEMIYYFNHALTGNFACYVRSYAGKPEEE